MLKQISAIFLSLLLLYNMMGYTLIYWVEDSLPAVESSTTIEEFKYISIPISMPYLNDWEKPEPAVGRISMDGNFYQIVEKQIINGKLQVKVKPDFEADIRHKELENHINDHYATNQNESNNKTTKLFKAIEKDYFNNLSKITIILIEWRKNIAQPIDNQLLYYPDSYKLIPSPPPKFFI